MGLIWSIFFVKFKLKNDFCQKTRKVLLRWKEEKFYYVEKYRNTPCLLLWMSSIFFYIFFKISTGDPNKIFTWFVYCFQWHKERKVLWPQLCFEQKRETRIAKSWEQKKSDSNESLWFGTYFSRSGWKAREALSTKRNEPWCGMKTKTTESCKKNLRQTYGKQHFTFQKLQKTRFFENNFWNKVRCLLFSVICLLFSILDKFSNRKKICY